MKKLIFWACLLFVLFFGTIVSAGVILTCDPVDGKADYIKLVGLQADPIIVKLGEANADGKKFFQYDITNLEPGTYTVSAIAGNNWGDESDSSSPLSFERPFRLSGEEVIINFRMEFGK